MLFIKNVIGPHKFHKPIKYEFMIFYLIINDYFNEKNKKIRTAFSCDFRLITMVKNSTLSLALVCLVDLNETQVRLLWGMGSAGHFIASPISFIIWLAAGRQVKKTWLCTYVNIRKHQVKPQKLIPRSFELGTIFEIQIIFKTSWEKFT